MSTRVIPKELLTAYQRWELSAMDDRDGPTAAGADRTVKLPTAEEIEQIHQQARQEGYKLGQDEGYKAGHAAGYEAGMRGGEKQIGRLAELAKALDDEALRRDEEIARELLVLSLAMAKQMVRTALRVKSELIIEMIRESLNSLPSLAGHLRIVVHPDDVEQVREFIGVEHGHMSVKVNGDARIERGGFKLESNFSELDGQLPSRWREIVACLGADDAWLEP